MDLGEWRAFFIFLMVVFGVQVVCTVAFAAAGLCRGGDGTCCGWGPRKIRNANIGMLGVSSVLFIFFAVIYAFSSDSVARKDYSLPLMIVEFASFLLACISARAAWAGHPGAAWTAAEVDAAREAAAP